MGTERKDVISASHREPRTVAFPSLTRGEGGKGGGSRHIPFRETNTQPVATQPHHPKGAFCCGLGHTERVPTGITWQEPLFPQETILTPGSKWHQLAILVRKRGKGEKRRNFPAQEKSRQGNRHKYRSRALFLLGAKDEQGLVWDPAGHDPISDSAYVGGTSRLPTKADPILVWSSA